MSGLTDPPKKQSKDADYVVQGSTVGELVDQLSVLPRSCVVEWVDYYEERTISTRRVTAGIGLKNHA